MQSSIASGLLRTALLAPLSRPLAAGRFRTRLAALLAPPTIALAACLAAMPVDRAHAQAALPTPADAVPAVSDPRSADTALAQAQRLVDEGRPDDALVAIDVALQATPSDPRLRFLKGVILSRQGRDQDAIEVFQALSQEFPELPEPHNNLAALHAARGDLDQARVALDNAVRALPSYALAHENLGDVYLRMAMRSWQQAAKLDPRNAAAAQKLKLAQQISSPNATPALPGSR